MSGDLTPTRRTILKAAGHTQKPFGPFADHQDCVEEFEDDPNVDDPDALCAEMERNPEQFFGGFDRADSMLQNLKVTFVSGVDMPAQDSEFLLAKSGDITLKEVLDQSDWSRRERPLLLAKELADDGEPEQKTWAPVLIPGEVDKQGDIVPVKEIELAAHEFLKNFRNIDTDHDLLSGRGEPIESYTLKQDQTFEKPDGTESREYPQGTWILGIEWSDEAWERIEAGELTGLSIFGEAEALDVGAIAEAAGGGEVTASMGVSLGKQLDPNDHEAISALISEFNEDFGEGVANLSDLLQWVDATDRQQEEAAVLLAGAAEEFVSVTGIDPGEALVEDFTRWLADQLAEGQEEQSASVDRKAIALAKRFERAAAGEPDVRQLAVKADRIDRLTAELT